MHLAAVFVCVAPAPAPQALGPARNRGAAAPGAAGPESAGPASVPLGGPLRPRRRHVGLQPRADRLPGGQDLLRGVREAPRGAEEAAAQGEARAGAGGRPQAAPRPLPSPAPGCGGAGLPEPGGRAGPRDPSC